MSLWGSSEFVGRLLWDVTYCITPALDGNLSHSDRTPCTQMMMSLNICGTVFYNLWHPGSHPLYFCLTMCFGLNCFCPSPPPMDKHSQLISIKFSYQPCVS